MGIWSNRVAKEELQPGDHIYSWRTAYTYTHHGIYVGDNRVIHFTRGRGQELGTGTSLDAIFCSSSSRDSGIDGFPCLDCGCTSQSHGVLVTCLDCFLSGGLLYLFHYDADWKLFLAKVRGGTCTMAQSDSSEAVLHRAHYLLKHGFGRYNVLENNCEDFALYCKTELLVVNKSQLGRSGQSAAFFGAPVSAMLSSPLNFFLASPVTMVTFAAGFYCAARYAHDIGVRSDTIKLNVEDLVLNLHFAENYSDEKDAVVRRMVGEPVGQ